MGTETLAQNALPEAELGRIARVLARFLAGRQPGAGGSQTPGRLPGQGLDFLDFRQYQSGDDFRSIDWRASARSSNMQVRRYCGDLASDWYLCVDVSASMGAQGGANRMLARQLATALAYVLLHLGHRVGMLLFSDAIDAACPLGRGHGQYARILKTLDSHDPHMRGGRSDLGACVAAIGQQRPVLVLSDFLTEDAMLASLNALLAGQRQLHLFQLNATELSALPGDDTLLLEDIESGHTQVCGDLALAQNEARRRLAAVQTDLTDWCNRFGVPLTRCNSDDSWRDLLLRHFLPG